MSKRDITKTNQAVRDLIVGTDDPRHRFLLMAYDRHRNLEMAGRYEEIFAPRHDGCVADVSHSRARAACEAGGTGGHKGPVSRMGRDE